MPFKESKKYLKEVILFNRDSFQDSRGYFEEIFKNSFFKDFFSDFNQDNLSKSKKGVLRGLHFQKRPEPQGKLVYCLEGKIFDVAVDIRKGSSNYGKWVGKTLSEKNKNMLFIPEGFAHGFCALEDSLVFYKCTNEYNPKLESGIIWNDPDLNIDWPIKNPILSKKDSSLPLLKNIDNNFIYEK